MTEKQYIDVSDLARIRVAQSCLKELIPANSSVVTEEEYKEVMEKLYTWTEKLYKKIKINGT